MTKQTINVGTSPNDNRGDSLRASFQKINANFTELYTALGLDVAPLNLGAFEFVGSTLSTTDSSAIVIDQATTITSNLTVGGDVLPSVANGGDLGSSARPWRSLYVSNNTIFLGGTALSVDSQGNLLVGGQFIADVGTAAWNSITGKPTFATVATTGAYADLTGKPTIPTSFSSLVNSTKTVSLASTGVLSLPAQALPIQTFNQITTATINRTGASTDTDAIATARDLWIGAEFTFTDIRDQDAELIAPATRPWAGMPSWEAYPLIQSYTPPGALLPPTSAISPAAQTAINAYLMYKELASNIDIVSGNMTFSFENTGALRVPGVITKDNSLILQSSGVSGVLPTGNSASINPNGNLGSVFIRTDNGTTLRTWQFDIDGVLTLPNGGQIANYPGGVGASNNSWFVTPGSDGNGGVSSQDGQQYIQINNNLPVEIGTSYGTENESIWRFGLDGDLTLPAGGTINNTDGIVLVTDRGTLAIGTNMETPGVAGHFHVAFDGSNSNPPASDLFLGDDYNYVKLPGYELNPTAQFGVEIGTDNRGAGPQNVEVDVVDELVPPGGVWRLFILIEDYPNLGSAVSVGDTVTTSWGTPITATVTGVVEAVGDGDWQIQVDQDITAGFSGGDTVSFGASVDSHVWRFGTDGALTFPQGTTIRTADGGEFLINGAVDKDVYIYTYSGETARGWIFGTDGNLTLPTGGDILDSNGNSVLGGGTGDGLTSNDDINITVNSEDSSSYTWNFGQTGKLTLPGMAVFGGTDGIALDDVAGDVGAIFNNKDVYITGGESLRFTQLNDDEGDATSVLRFWNTGNTRWDGNNDESELATIRVGNDAQENDPVQGFIVLAPEDQENGDALFKFSSNGSLTFPDGTIQTTAYTGSGAQGTFFVVVNEDGTVSKSTDGVTWTTGADQGASIDRVATNGVTVAMIQSDQLSWTTFAGLEASTYVSGSSGTSDEIGGGTVDWNQIDYAGGYFVAVGSCTPTGSSFTQGVYGYSTDGRSWTFETVDQTVVEFFGNDPVDSDWQFSDVDYNGVGWMFSVDEGEGGGANGGGVYITDLTATITSARCFSMSITYRAAWNGSAWYMEGGDPTLGGVNTNLDPRNGTFAGPIDPWATAIQDLGLDDAGSTTELAGGNGYIAAADSDGHVAWSDDNGQTWQIVTPIPYTRNTSAITQASPAVVTVIDPNSGGSGANGEKVVISGSSVSGYNGTFYWKSADNSLYTDQALTTPFDTSGLAPFTGTATLTWSNGQFIDAMDFVNGYFYIGNDDEQIARTTNFVSWTILDDQGSSEFDYWNDIAGFVGTASGDLGDIVVEVDSEYTKLTLANKDFTLETTRTGGQDADINLTAADDIFIEANGDDIALSAADQVRINTGDFNGDPGEYPVWTFDNVGDLTIPGNIKSEGNINIDINLSDSTLRRWTFGEDGNLNLPVGGDIKDSNGNSVLGGGDANVWVQTFETQNGAPTDIVSLAISVEYDDAGNVIALFDHVNDDNNSTYYSVGKYTTTGVKIWTARFNDEFNTDGWGLAVDNDTDSIYVAGETEAEGGQDNATLTKLDSTDGSVLWSKIYDFGFSSQSSVVDVASDGDPVMVGYASNGTDDYVATTKVDAADGSVIWSRALDGQGDDEAYGMAVGPTGEVVAIGFMDQLGLGSTNAVATVVTVPSSNLNWTTQYSGGGTNVNYQGIIFDIIVTDGVPAITIKTDPVGNRTIGDTIMTLPGDSFGGTNGVDDMVVNVASVSSAAGSQDNHMLVVKYDSAGSIQWQKAILFDAGFDCRGADADIDSAGNIYVTGSYQYSFDEGITSALSILKLDGTGVKQWSRRVTGDCDTFGVSVVVGADDKLYLSAMTGNNDTPEYIWVAAKYGIDGTVEWQRLIDNTAGWTFTGGVFFADGGGSNIAVKDGYVLLGGGFGDLPNSGVPQATLIQVAAAGDVFSVGDWDFKAASFSGVLSADASDITVVNAGKTDTDNAENITTGTVTLTTEVSGFLLGTLYSATANNRLFNGSNELVLGTTGTVTLPSGGTITEGYVTSNPTIQLTPASPTVASQKLVIKGGANYIITDNGITLNYQFNTALPGATLDFYIDNAITYANQTLYWWIYPEGALLTTPSSGTIALNGSGNSGEESISFVVDSDAYEFTVRVSPENNNYDPANVGVESGLINADAPTFEGDHHLHLTTGNLAETSIFLGTDDHNVRTTTDGTIQITTSDTVNNVWEFDTTGGMTLPQGGVISEVPANSSQGILLTPKVQSGANPDMAVRIYPTFTDDDHIHITAGNPATVDLFLGDDIQYVKIEADGGNVVISADDPADVKWTFGTNGKLSKLGDVTLTAGGQFNICTINASGSGYTGDDPLPATTTGGTGTGMTVTFGYGTEGQLANVAVADPGTGYVNGDVIGVNGGTGTFVLTQYNTLGNQANSNFAQSEWTFSPDGKLTFPTLTVPISDNATPSGTGQTIKFGDSSQQAIIFGPASTAGATSAQRVIIQGAPGFTGTTGEGGDVYLWAGPGGSLNGGGGDIKVRAGYGNGLGTGGYLNFQAGDSLTGDGGWINIESGQSNTYGQGGDITVQAHDGGEIFLRTHNSITTQTWTFGPTGSLTLPGAVVHSTVAKTGVILPTTTGVVDTLAHDSVLTGLTDAQYGPFTLGTVTFSVAVSGGVINNFVSVSSTANVTINDVLGTIDSGDIGGTAGTTITVTVNGVVQATPTAIDLTKTINKLTNGIYSLADGVEGQIMYLVPRNGVNPEDVSVSVAHSRIAGIAYTPATLAPFRVYEYANDEYYNSTGMCTLIFTDDAWQQQGGAWD